MAKIIQSIGDAVYQEVPIADFPGPTESRNIQNLRFDIVSMSSACNHNLSADITVSNPISSSASTLARNARRNGNANNYAEARKNSQYAEVSRSRGLEFFPFAIETFGRLGKQFDKCLKVLATRGIAQSEVDQLVANKLHASLIHLWKMKISCVLQKGNVRIIQMASARIHSRNRNPSRPILNFGVLQERLFH